MGVFLMIGLLAGMAAGLLVSALLAVFAVLMTVKQADRRKYPWVMFAVVTTLMTAAGIIAVNAYPWPPVQPGSDYDIAMKNLFYCGIGYGVSPGIATVLAYLATLALPKQNPDPSAPAELAAD